MRNKLKIFGMVVLMLTTVIFMSSCNKNEKNIVGKWKVTHAPSSLGSMDEGSTWTFKDGGKCIVTFSGYEFDGEYYVSKNSLSITAKIDESEKLQWDMDIDVLTKKEMSLSGKIKEIYVYYGDSETYTVSYDFVKM